MKIAAGSPSGTYNNAQQWLSQWSKPCKAMTPECGYYGPTTTNINKAPVKPSRVLPEELQRQYDCAAETGYPGCLIPASPGAPTCKLAVNKEMSDKFHACLNKPVGPAALGVGFTCYSCNDGKPVLHTYSSLEQDGCPVGQTMGLPNNTACLQSIGTTTTTTAGVGGKSNLLMYLLVGAGLYYAYSQGMFKKLIK